MWCENYKLKDVIGRLGCSRMVMLWCKVGRDGRRWGEDVGR